MAHPLIHSKSSVRKWGGKVEDYQHIHDWFDETKSWLGHSNHRAFRHHSEGIFECEKIFGKSFTNSDGKTVYTRYVGEQHVIIIYHLLKSGCLILDQVIDLIG